MSNKPAEPSIPGGHCSFAGEITTHPPRRKCLGVVGCLFLAAFAIIGLGVMVRVCDPRVYPANSLYVSSDSYLLATIGVPRASERLVELLGSLPEGEPILFIGPEGADSMMTSYLISSLATPRPVYQAGHSNRIELPEGITPSAILFYKVQPPHGLGLGVQIGALTFIRVGGEPYRGDRQTVCLSPPFPFALVAISLVCFAGFGVAMLLASTRRPLGWIELVALSWLLGAAFVSISLFTLGLVFSGIWLQGAMALLCIGLAVWGVRIQRGRSLSVPSISLSRAKVAAVHFPGGWANRALALLVCAQVIFLWWLASRQCFGWDGLVVWEIKARTAFLNGGIPGAAYFADSTRIFSHQNYPLFLPMLESWCYTWIGHCDQSSVRVINPVFYTAGIALLGAGAARLTGNSRAGLVAAALPFFLPWIMQRDGGVLGGYADLPLGIFYLAGVLYLMAFLRGHEASDLRFFVAASTVLPWVKTEGTILWVCLSLLAVFTTWSRLGPRALLLPLPGAGLIAMWAGFQHLMHVARQPVFLPATASTLLANAGRGLPIAHETLKELGDLNHWSLLWYGVAFALLWLVAHDRTRASLVVVSALAVPLLIFPSIYVFSADPVYLTHLWVSLPRLLLQLAPTGVLAIALVIPGVRSGAGI